MVNADTPLNLKVDKLRDCLLSGQSYDPIITLFDRATNALVVRELKKKYHRMFDGRDSQARFETEQSHKGISQRLTRMLCHESHASYFADAVHELNDALTENRRLHENSGSLKDEDEHFRASQSGATLLTNSSAVQKNILKGIELAANRGRKSAKVSSG